MNECQFVSNKQTIWISEYPNTPIWYRPHGRWEMVGIGYCTDENDWCWHLLKFPPIIGEEKTWWNNTEHWSGEISSKIYLGWQKLWWTIMHEPILSWQVRFCTFENLDYEIIICDDEKRGNLFFDDKSITTIFFAKSRRLRLSDNLGRQMSTSNKGLLLMIIQGVKSTD